MEFPFKVEGTGSALKAALDRRSGSDRRMLETMIASIMLALAIHDPRVTFMTRAARAESVLPALGRVIGKTLVASPGTGDEVLIIDVKGVPLSHLLDRIARVTSGKWVRIGSRLSLEPDTAMRDREALEAQKSRLDGARQYLGRVKETLGREIEGDKERSRRKDVSSFETQQEALDELRDRLMLTVDPTSFANLKPGERIVFSTKPTAVQKGLSQTALQTLAAYEGPGADADRVLLAIYKPDDTHAVDTFSKVLGLYDRSGKYLNSTMDETFFGLIDYIPASHPPTDKPVTFRAESSILINASEEVRMDISDVESSPDLGIKLSNPMQYDPLSYFQTDEIVQYAKRERKPLVADLPDRWRSLPQGLEAYEVQSDLSEKVKSGFSVRRLRDDEFVTLKPADPAAARSTRMNRTALEQFFRSSNEKGVASIDDVCRFVQSSPKPEVGLPIRSFLNVAAHVIADSSDGEDWETLRLYATLSVSERLKAASPEGLGIEELSHDQKDLLAHWLYSSIWTTCHQDGDGYHLFQASPFELFTGVYFPKSSSLEPTESFPNGIPGEAKLHLDVSRADCVLANAAKGKVILGERISGRPDQLRCRKDAVLDFKPLSRTTMTLRLSLGGGIEAEARIFDYRLPTQASAVGSVAR